MKKIISRTALGALILSLSMQSVVYAGPVSSSRDNIKTKSFITGEVTTVATLDRVELTVSKAAERAIAQNSAIKKAQESEELSDDQYKEALDNLYAASSNTSIVNAQVSLMSLQMQRSLNLKDIESQKQNVEYQIMKYFNTIINAEKDLDLYDEDLKLTERELKITELKLELGMVSQTDYAAAKLSYDKKISSRQEMVNAIDKAYRDLNEYMGINPSQRYTLILELEYAPLDEVNITAYAETFVSKSTTVEQVENSYTTAKYKVDNYSTPYDPTNGVIMETVSTSYEQLVINLNQAARNLSDTKDSVRTTVIQTYNTLKETEITIANSELELEKSRNDLEILKKKLELGQATQLEFDKASYNLESAENSLNKAKKTFALSKLSFLNPNLLLSGASAGGASTGGASAGGASTGGGM